METLCSVLIGGGPWVTLAATTTTQPAASPGASDEFWVKFWAAVVIGVIGIVVAVVQEVIRRGIRGRLMDGLKRPVKVPRGDKRNSIILLGLGGTGKTTLIKNLLHTENAHPEEKTTKFEIFHTVRKSDADLCSYWFWISDYKGQNLGTLTGGFALQQKKPFAPMAYPHITSLILMVDLVMPPPDNKAPDPPPQPKPDGARTTKHAEQWSLLALDGVFGMLSRDSLQFVCLFINKVDLMSDQSDAAKTGCVAEFDELRKRIEGFCKDVPLKVILGSAKYGTGMPELEESLRRTSVASS